jgi:hypothetical protein
VFERGGAAVVTDPVSLEFLRGAVIEYEDSLMRSAFQVRLRCAARARVCMCVRIYSARVCCKMRRFFVLAGGRRCRFCGVCVLF